MRTPLSEVRQAARPLMKPFAVEYIAVCGPPKLATAHFGAEVQSCTVLGMPYYLRDATKAFLLRP